MFKELKKMLNGIALDKIKHWPKWAMFYCLGIVTVFIFGFIAATIDPPIIGTKKEMLNRWEINETNGKQLTLEFNDTNEIPWKVVIQKNETSNLVENIMLLNVTNGVERHVFRYIRKSDDNVLSNFGLGGYDGSVVKYGWNVPNEDSYCWTDINLDSCFDERQSPSKYEILVGDNWEQGKKVFDDKKIVKTVSGNYVFDIYSGKWINAIDKDKENR